MLPTFLTPESVKQLSVKEIKKVDNLLICSILRYRQNIIIPLANEVVND